MDAVDGQNDHDEEIGNQQAEVEAVEFVESLKGLVEDVRLEPLVHAVALHDREQKDGKSAEQGCNLES